MHLVDEDITLFYFLVSSATESDVSFVVWPHISVPAASLV
jgi:hypothetical protein